MRLSPIKPLALALGFTLTASMTISYAAIDPKSFDSSSSACSDFYAYVNGVWAKANTIPADRTAWGTFEILDEQSLATQHDMLEGLAKNTNQTKASSIEKKLGDFYASGMDATAINKAGIDPLKPELARIDALQKTDDIADYLTESHTRGVGQLFGLAGEADFKNSRMVIAYVGQSGLGLPERDYYLNDKEDYKKIREEYLAHISRSLELVGVKKDQADQQAKQILSFETRLAKASLGRVELRDPANQYNFVSMAEAEKATPHFSWTTFFQKQGVTSIEGFSLSQPGFFTEVDKMLTEIPVSEWQAYLRFHAIDGAAPYLSDAFAEENFNFYGKTLRGQKEMKPRWKRVLGSVEDGMGMALGELYVAKNFSPEAKQRAQELVNNLSLALKARIERLDWMSAETKQKALEKWKTFMPKIGYPDKWRDWSSLSVVSDSYLGNVLAATKFDHDWRMAKIGKPVDRSEWEMTPQTVNAYYNPLQNEIVFPAAILQPPFFDAKADDALNYGGIGAVIGHEMIHGYDDQGSQFDAQGNYANWWSKTDHEKFEARTGVLVQQFDDYVAIEDLHIKGKLTLGENIADLGGVNLAYDALQMALSKNSQAAATKIDSLTQEQRFFVNFAQVWRRNFRPEELKLRLNTDPHAPGMYRAIGAPSNMPAFAKAFSCKEGDAMVRTGESQVKIW